MTDAEYASLQNTPLFAIRSTYRNEKIRILFHQRKGERAASTKFLGLTLFVVGQQNLTRRPEAGNGPLSGV